jgi:hypothetical protein
LLERTYEQISSFELQKLYESLLLISQPHY